MRATRALRCISVLRGGGGASSFFSGGTQFNFAQTTLAALLSAGLTNAVATTNPPGTVVSSDGNVQYGAHNLLTWSANASSAFGGKTVATTLAAGSITFTNVSTGYAYGVTASLPAGTYTMRVTFSGPAGRAVGVRVCDSATGTQQASQAVTCTGASQTITLTVTTTSAGTIDAGFDARSGVVPGTTLVNGDVIQFAQYQLNLGPTALDYVPTTTAAVYAPRLSYRGATQVLKREPARTNLLLNSATVTTQSITVVSGSTYTISFEGNGSSVTFSGAYTGTVNGAASRVSQVFTAASTTLTIASTTGSPVNGQVELGGWATSYIPTGASAVTRDADLIRPGNIITDGPMTVLFYGAVDKASSGANQALLGCASGGWPLYVNNVGDVVAYDVTNMVSSGVTLSDGVLFRAASCWSGGSMSVSVNGSAAVAGSFDGTMAGGVVEVGSNGAGGIPASCDVVSLQLVGAAASAAQLAQLSVGTLT